jgi:hypothetical protein
MSAASGASAPPNDDPSKPDPAAPAAGATDASGDVEMEPAKPEEPELDQEILNASAEECVTPIGMTALTESRRIQTRNRLIDNDIKVGPSNLSLQAF